MKILVRNNQLHLHILYTSTNMYRNSTLIFSYFANHKEFRKGRNNYPEIWYLATAQRCILPVFFRWIYYYGNNESTGNEIGKTHLCALEDQRHQQYLISSLRFPTYSLPTHYLIASHIPDEHTYCLYLINYRV